MKDLLKDIETAIKENNALALKNILEKNQNIITLKNNKIVPASPQAKTQIQDLAEYWDKQQYVRKILLNSLYGAILNPYCRFYDERIGQSVTLSGRKIVQHMCAIINEIITGKYDYKGDSIVYSDTDSCYFTAYLDKNKILDVFSDMKWTKENSIELYDGISDIMNESWSKFMADSFFIPKSRCVIKASREMVSIRGLFVSKKRYAVLIFDKEHVRLDQDGKPGKIKAMGLELKRSDTPEKIQIFLEEILMDTLNGVPESDIIEKIKSFKKHIREWNPWELGTPKRVNNISVYTEKEKNKGSIAKRMEFAERLSQARTAKEKKIILGEMKKLKSNMLPGHVSAAINWNTLRNMHGDSFSMPIIDGQKTIVCKLKKNPWEITSIAYPIDQLNLPEWFKKLPFDVDAMIETILDQKLENIFGILKWNISATQNDLFETFLLG